MVCLKCDASDVSSQVLALLQQGVTLLVSVSDALGHFGGKVYIGLKRTV